MFIHSDYSDRITHLIMNRYILNGSDATHPWLTVEEQNIHALRVEKVLQVLRSTLVEVKIICRS